MSQLRRFRGAVSISLSQLRTHRERVILAVAGVTLAVLLVLMLTGLGYGLTTTGNEAIGWLNRDLWAASGAITFAPGAVGGVENPIQGAHGVSSEMGHVEGVEETQAFAFQSVYVSPNRSSFESVVGIGGTGNGSGVNIRSGRRFSTEDVHYANGSYDGPLTREVIVGPRLADQFNLSLNDTLYIGGTIYQARQNPFRVVGVSNTFTRFLGTPTVALHLSELQEVSGTTGTDPAAIIAISTTDGADGAVVEQRLERQFDEFEVRSNDEQVASIIGSKGPVLAAAGTLVTVAVITGVALVVNTLVLFVVQQREQLAALKAAGISGRLLAIVTLSQGAVIGGVGGLLGALLSVPAVDAVNRLVADLSGFPELIKIPPWLLVAGASLAIVVGLLGSIAAAWQVTRLSPLAHLRR
jgi:putative ABC transport system permease protein